MHERTRFIECNIVYPRRDITQLKSLTETRTFQGIAYVDKQ